MHNFQKIKILIACEFTVFRNGFKLLIEKEENLSICAEATDPNDIFRLIKESSPNIIILNLNLLPDLLNSLCKNIYLKHPKIPILLFINDPFKLSIADLIINGVRGILWKDNSKDELIKAIICVANGKSFFEDPNNCKLNCKMSHKICDNKDIKEINNILSNRETEILKLISQGLSYREIADKLTISHRTVESHKYNIQSKLGLKTTNELIRYAVDIFNL